MKKNDHSLNVIFIYSYLYVAKVDIFNANFIEMSLSQ